MVEIIIEVTCVIDMNAKRLLISLEFPEKLYDNLYSGSLIFFNLEISKCFDYDCYNHR